MDSEVNIKCFFKKRCINLKSSSFILLKVVEFDQINELEVVIPLFFINRKVSFESYKTIKQKRIIIKINSFTQLHISLEFKHKKFHKHSK